MPQRFTPAPAPVFCVPQLDPPLFNRSETIFTLHCLKIADEVILDKKTTEGKQAGALRDRLWLRVNLYSCLSLRYY